MPKLKVREQDKQKISRSDFLNNKPTHLKFNLSFITPNNRYCFDNQDFTAEHKLQLLERIYFLSRDDLVRTLAYPKNIGLEFIGRTSFRRYAAYNARFDDAEFRKKEGDSKYSVFRIYPNNTPLPARIIGKLINNVFYIMYIDLRHEMYEG